jgi:hypothetical protein
MIDMTARPVSAKLCEFLEADIARHQIVVWIDPNGHFSKFVDDLREAGGWVAPVLAHRGSYLELMVELEHHAGSIDKAPVLVHLPGPIEVKSTPMLEIYCAGKQFRKALDTLIREAAVGRSHRPRSTSSWPDPRSASAAPTPGWRPGCRRRRVSWRRSCKP